MMKVANYPPFLTVSPCGNLIYHWRIEVTESTDAAVNHVLKAAAVVLDVQSVGTDDNFFDLGGDSIGAIELCTEIERATGFEVPLEMIWDTDTFAALAQAISPHLVEPAETQLATSGKGASAGNEGTLK